MNAFFQFGWRVGVASSALWVIYFAFQQGIASLYGVTAEKALLAWNHSPATLSAVDDAHKAIQSAIEYSPEHPQYYFLQGRIFQWQAYLAQEQDTQQALHAAKTAFLESAERRPTWPDTWAELLKIEAQLSAHDATTQLHSSKGSLDKFMRNADRYGPYTPAVNIAISQVGLAHWKQWDSEQKWLVIEHLARGLDGKNSRHLLADYLKSAHQFKLACTLASRREPKLEISICNSVLK
ncbi:exopolysaccharide biosynthesis protein VpsP [Vibrio cholerae]|nr:exopolysaccharide biosynthesis protein VpsP [Vibrio cholerae]EKF6144950.1 exopolysaccharide biosynthesis protein VpsP [Vibrio cholerae]EKF9619462.1 exopolysaccharide biosynthesis protein VpsP [Vibrio cholerae]ELE0370804.1 exopolysaccharide biosynthesis protein VpsP [Vibrio cholerae]ELL0942473.1 exopolysaccharide biosynthesis protein VpsP [Vibrio cholerae]